MTSSGHKNSWWLSVMSIGVCSGSVQLEKLASLGSQPVFGTESAIRPDSLQRAGASGLWHQLLVRFGNDVENRG